MSTKHEYIDTQCIGYKQKPRWVCSKEQSHLRQNKDLMTNGSLMKVESIAEGSPWSILQYFDLH